MLWSMGLQMDGFYFLGLFVYKPKKSNKMEWLIVKVPFYSHFKFMHFFKMYCGSFKFITPTWLFCLRDEICVNILFMCNEDQVLLMYVHAMSFVPVKIKIRENKERKKKMLLFFKHSYILLILLTNKDD